jgi:hypothetical protein
MTTKLNVVDYKDQVDGKNVYQGYTVRTNCLWVTITKNERGTGRETEEVVFKREPINDDWLDAAHDRIGKAIHELEAAILAAVRKEN